MYQIPASDNQQWQDSAHAAPSHRATVTLHFDDTRSAAVLLSACEIRLLLSFLLLLLLLLLLLQTNITRVSLEVNIALVILVCFLAKCVLRMRINATF